MMPGHWFGWGGMLGGGLLVLVVTCVLIGLIVWGIVAMSRPGRRHWHEHPPVQGGGPTPLDIAKERYARGEITREQYETMRKDLE